jgi:hypothetical protein
MRLKTNPKPIDKYGYPIHKFEKCFQCGKEFCLTFSFAQQNYSQKHFWFYWTEQEADQEKFICSPCLRKFYLERRQEFLATVKNLQKRNNLRSYISDKLI